MVNLCRRRVASAEKNGRVTAGTTMLTAPAWPWQRPWVSLPGTQPSRCTVDLIPVCTLVEMQLAPPIINEMASKDIFVVPVMLCTLITAPSFREHRIGLSSISASELAHHLVDPAARAMTLVSSITMTVDGKSRQQLKSRLKVPISSVLTTVVSVRLVEPVSVQTLRLRLVWCGLGKELTISLSLSELQMLKVNLETNVNSSTLPLWVALAD